MMGKKTLSEIRAELRSKGIDTDRLREELTQLFAQPRKDQKTVQILASLTNSENSETLAKTRKSRTAASKGGT